MLVARDSFSFALYFLTYEFLRRKAAADTTFNKKILIDLASGGCAGKLCWLTKNAKFVFFFPPHKLVLVTVLIIFENK